MGRVEDLVAEFKARGPAKTREEASERLCALAAMKNEMMRGADPLIADKATKYWEQVKPTGRSRGGAMTRGSKPKDGDAAYVWRMIRFHDGEDTHLPVMAEFDIEFGSLDEDPRRDAPWGSPAREAWNQEWSEFKKAKTAELDEVVDFLLNEKLCDKQYRGARAWAPYLG